jgi:dTDP-glucose 4,6-dehydratase
MLDRDETSLLNLQLSISGDGLLTNENIFLGDIRDKERIDEIFDKLRPEIVIHAAALKHLMTLERFPDEAHKTNVIGTKNIIDSCRKYDVGVFINISTDKAADPSSILGKSKLNSEKLTAEVNLPNRKYLSVRFGNVVGSNGSFLNTFKHQISTGGPVTVTDPEVTRFFMTISEAAHLVLYSGVIGETGETLILDMGDPVKIDSVARMMIAKSKVPIEIVYTGLRIGEKLHEVLVSRGESIEIRGHPKIFHTRVLS